MDVFKEKDSVKQLLLVGFSTDDFNVTFWPWEDKCEPTTRTQQEDNQAGNTRYHSDSVASFQCCGFDLLQ